MIKCNRCSKLKETRKFERGRKTCRKCRSEYKKKHSKECGECSLIFNTHNKSAKYCSRECVAKSRRERTLVKCEQCGENKEVSISSGNRVSMNFCNQSCRTEYLKISMSGVGNPNYARIPKKCDVCFAKIEVHPYQIENLKHHFCSRSCFIENIGKYYTGENNSNWNEVLSEEERNDLRRYPEYYKWRSDVYNRDKYTCQSCGNSESGNLNAHHIENYSENIDRRTDVSNGITLCVDCHISFHKTYGYTGNNEKQLNEFIKTNKASTA